MFDVFAIFQLAVLPTSPYTFLIELVFGLQRLDAVVDHFALHTAGYLGVNAFGAGYLYRQGVICHRFVERFFDDCYLFIIVCLKILVFFI